MNTSDFSKRLKSYHNDERSATEAERAYWHNQWKLLAEAAIKELEAREIDREHLPVTLQPKQAELMLQLPVLVNFDVTKVVGYLHISKRVVPELPNFHFSLGFSAKHNPISKSSHWEWRAVSLLPDDRFQPLQQDAKGVYL